MSGAAPPARAPDLALVAAARVRADRRLVAGTTMFSRCWPAAGPAASAAPFVMIHGLALSGAYLAPTAERLAMASVGDVYAPDLPGFGRSGAPRETLDVPGLAAALRTWLDAVDLPAAVLVGHSLGAEVAVELARRAPERVAALVLASPTVDPAHRRVLAEVARLAWDTPRERPGLVLRACASYARAGPRRALATLRAAIAYRIEDALPEVVAPTTVLWGTRDPLVSAAWVGRLAHITGRPPIALAGAPHGLPFTAAAAFAAALAQSVGRSA